MTCTGRNLLFAIIYLCSVYVVNNAYTILNENRDSVNKLVPLSDIEEKSKIINETLWGTKPSEVVHAAEDQVETSTLLNKILLDHSYSKWTLLWKDDFDGPVGSLPSRDEWLFDIGTSYPGGPPNWGNKEVQSYTDDPNNVSVDGNGVLRITPVRDVYGQWTSARIETKRSDFRPPHNGMMAIEGRIRMPQVTGEAALGYWPAFWALGSPLRGHYYNWPQIGEFDIMENVNGLDSVWGVLHCGLKPNDPCREPSGIGRRRSCPGSTCQSDFHTYRMEWDASKERNEFRWFVDGELYHSVTSDVMDKESWDSMTNHSGYFILLNVAMGGSFPNGFEGPRVTPTERTESGHPMLIDYVAVYILDSQSNN